MDIETLRKRLHEYVDNADKRHLSAMYVLIEDNIPVAKDEIYDEVTLNMQYQRRENHLNGTSKSYSVEEAMEFVRQKAKIL